MINLRIFTSIHEKQMNATIENRIHEMENPGYRFPIRFGKRDYIVAAAVAAICLFMIIWGYYL